MLNYNSSSNKIDTGKNTQIQEQWKYIDSKIVAIKDKDNTQNKKISQNNIDNVLTEQNTGNTTVQENNVLGKDYSDNNMIDYIYNTMF